MKKIDSNDYGHKIILLALVFWLPIPLALWGIGAWINITMRVPILVSLFIGTAIAVFLCVLLAIELHQDKALCRRYDKECCCKLRVGAQYECQDCGSRQVSKADTSCPVCGQRFSP